MTTLSQSQVQSPQAARRTALLFALVALVTAVISLAVSISQRTSSDGSPAAARPAPATQTAPVTPGVPADAAAKHAAVLRAQKAAESEAVHVRPTSPRQDEAVEDGLLRGHKGAHAS